MSFEQAKLGRDHPNSVQMVVIRLHCFYKGIESTHDVYSLARVEFMQTTRVIGRNVPA